MFAVPLYRALVDRFSSADLLPFVVARYKPIPLRLLLLYVVVVPVSIGLSLVVVPFRSTPSPSSNFSSSTTISTGTIRSSFSSLIVGAAVSIASTTCRKSIFVVFVLHPKSDCY